MCHKLLFNAIWEQYYILRTNMEYPAAMRPMKLHSHEEGGTGSCHETGTRYDGLHLHLQASHPHLPHSGEQVIFQSSHLSAGGYPPVAFLQ